MRMRSRSLDLLGCESWAFHARFGFRDSRRFPLRAPFCKGTSSRPRARSCEVAARSGIDPGPAQRDQDAARCWQSALQLPSMPRQMHSGELRGTRDSGVVCLEPSLRLKLRVWIEKSCSPSGNRWRRRGNGGKAACQSLQPLIAARTPGAAPGESKCCGCSQGRTLQSPRPPGRLRGRSARGRGLGRTTLRHGGALPQSRRRCPG